MTFGAIAILVVFAGWFVMGVLAEVSNAGILEISLMRRFSAGSYERPCNAEILAEFL